MITIYTRSWCGYCAAALHLLRKKGVAFEQIDVSGDRIARTRLAIRAGSDTVPQIFVDDRPIGGYRELRALERDGELDRLLGVIQDQR